mmetsp:Transcript_10725/g.18846  ORF Transcript_10725/g.18846 Transcript_10725/m.18846 type:complete len:447 (-) Transcript_10725:123-1463(-)|eukprot:CAMPEP_0183727070 /NCGR_PEP_ID=MMETSP0737-20130205/24790_1 /TAXON_ID=385413 /ORGANISM="Thalassiosira miniscula, Strain CCMP1093" /LENGTH=446 /DNA_ID=CAMNT_0025958605 /DNA_START=199 /DNA_END=1539 /DNA_ORIENTATION=-
MGGFHSFIELMDRNEFTLRWIEVNDHPSTTLEIGRHALPDHSSDSERLYVSGDDVSARFLAKLGKAIAFNTRLQQLEFHGGVSDSLAYSDKFFDGIKRNVSIHSIRLVGYDFSNPASYELLNRLGEKNRSSNVEHSHSIRSMDLLRCRFDRRGVAMRALSKALRKCTCLTIRECNGVSFQLKGLVAAIREIDDLERFSLRGADIREDDFEAFVPILEGEINGNLKQVFLGNIRGKKYITELGNALRKNKKLERVEVTSDAATTRDGDDWASISRMLCDISSPNATYSCSNHTLQHLDFFARTDFFGRAVPGNISFLLEMNKSSNNKKLIAVQKLLMNHSYFDMTPFFEWEIKGLPTVVDWFEEMKPLATDEKFLDAIFRYQLLQSLISDFYGQSHNDFETISPRYVEIIEAKINAMKLDAIYQFIRMMPEACEQIQISELQMADSG